MSAQQCVKTDERTVTVLYAANTWSLNFIIFALLIDMMYRSVVLDETAWDLFALFGVSGVIQSVYLARHKALGQLFGWKVAIILAVLAFVVGIVAAIVTMTNVI